MDWQQVRNLVPIYVLSLVIASVGRWAMASEGWIVRGTWQYFAAWQAIFTVHFGIYLLVHLRRYRRQQTTAQTATHQQPDKER